MTRSESIERMFQTYGNTLTLWPKDGQKTVCKGILQPLGKTSAPKADELASSWDGEGDPLFFYIGPASCRVDQCLKGTRMEQYGVFYELVRSYCVLFGDSPLYVWATLRKSANQEGGE